MVFINSIILLILDLYIYKALRATKIKFVKSKLFNRLWWGYSILTIILVMVSIYFNIPLALRSIILVLFFMTFTVKFIFTIIIAIDDIRRGGVWLTRIFYPTKKTSILNKETMPLPEVEVNGISRSDFLLKTGIVVASLPIVPLVYGMVGGAYDYTVRKQTLLLPNLPKSFDGMTIAQISDVHSGSFYNKKAVTGGVEMLLAEKPDMIFVTGDLVNNVASEMKDYQDIFAKLKAPLGVYSVLGNHDYGHYHFGPDQTEAKAKNLQDLIDCQRIMGWDLLLNENRKIVLGGDEIAIVGVENWGAGRFPKYGKLDESLVGTDESSVKLLLSHDPSHWRSQVIDRPDVDVTFSGHTHGMQFGVRAEHFQWSPVKYVYNEWAGLYQEGASQLYVNTGFGFLGYPGRVGIVPEITIFELKKA